jgi:hypothetical protein
MVPEVGLNAEIYNNKNSSLLIGFFDTKQTTHHRDRQRQTQGADERGAAP